MNIFDLQCQINSLKDCCHNDILLTEAHIAGHPAGEKKLAVNYLSGLLYYKDVNDVWALYNPSTVAPTSSFTLTTSGTTGSATYNSTTKVLNIPTPSIPPPYELILTTNGTDGAATYNPSNNTLNVPIYNTTAATDGVVLSVNGILPDNTGNVTIPDSASGEEPLAYRALLTQIGTAAPVITPQQNTLGVTPTISRISEGVYHLTAPIFTLTGTNYHIQSGQAFFSALFVEPNIIEIRTDQSDDLLFYTPIEIKIYS